MSVDRPIVFLAFADAAGDLPELRAEARALQQLFEAFQVEGRCTLVYRPNSTLEEIYDVLTEYRDRIAIFHFGGHADSGRILLDSAVGQAPAHGTGLAKLLGQQRGLRLVFLNGCSTRPQVQGLLIAGVQAVIATAREIDDRVARTFAVAFYTALTRGGAGLDGGKSVSQAFEAAKGFALAHHGDRPRDMVVHHPAGDDLTDPYGFPWDLLIRPGAEVVGRWSLFGDDPLFGLPELPDDIGLPAEPFRGLAWFGREDARIFFGRGRAVRELYGLITSPATPTAALVILYYGQTGVGKTSVLAAGLLPRLEEAFQTRYLRRDAALGLLGTLRKALPWTPDGVPFDLGVAWREAEARDERGRPLVLVLDQAEEAFTRPLVAGPAVNVAPGSGPTVTGSQAEVRDLFEALLIAFDPTRPERPQGRLILGFRREWLDEFEEALKAQLIPFEAVALAPLDRAGVIDAVEGPTRLPRYRLTIAPDRETAPPGEPPLAESLADDLLVTLADPRKNEESPVAPTLQLLLSRMWAEARGRCRDRPTFDRALYADLKAKGYELGNVLDQQLAVIAVSDPEAVGTGLVLDVLEWFTTAAGTAAARTKAALYGRYSDQASDRLDALLEACKNHYMLAEVRVRGLCDAAMEMDSAVEKGLPGYRLTHDSLAPLLRERYRTSVAVAQRARRLLENRAPEWAGKETGPVLDRTDLDAVEQGLHWMRAREKDEARLLEASRRARADFERLEAERLRQLQEGKEREERLKAEKQWETELRLKDQERSNRRLKHRLAGLLSALAATAVVAMIAAYQSERAGKEREKALTNEAKAKTEATQAKEATRRAEEATRRAEDQVLRTRRVSEFLADLFRTSDPIGFLGPGLGSGTKNGQTMTAREILDTGVKRIDRQLENEPEVRATLLNTLGDVSRSLGLYDQAGRSLQEALDLRIGMLGDQNLEVAESKHNLAWLYQDQGYYERAEPLYRESLTVRLMRLGHEHPLVAQTEFHLGWLLIVMGRYDEAESLLRDVIAIRSKQPGEGERDVALARGALASMYIERGESLAGLALGFQAVKAILREDGSDAFKIVGQIQTAIVARHRNPALAVSLLTDSLIKARQILGNVHIYI